MACCSFVQFLNMILFKIYLFFCCARSSLLSLRGLSLTVVSKGYCSHCSGFIVEEHGLDACGLSGCGLRTLDWGLSSGTRA